MRISSCSAENIDKYKKAIDNLINLIGSIEIRESPSGTRLMLLFDGNLKREEVAEKITIFHKGIETLEKLLKMLD